MSIVIIAEKPDAARRIAEALAERKSLKSYTDENKVTYYEFERNGKKHIVACAVGHLFNLAPVERGWRYPVFNYTWKPSFEVNKQSAFSKKYFDVVKKIVSNGSSFIIATDYDTEGCLPFEEKIVVKDENGVGIESVGELAERYFEKYPAKKWGIFEYVEPNGVLVSMMDENFRTRFGRVKKIMKRGGDKRILQITTELERKIRVSKNHPMIVLSELGLIVKGADKIKIGDYLPVAKNLPFSETRISKNSLVGPILEGYVHFLKVKRIEEVEYDGELYDLETECGNFVHGNGVVTHNSVIGYNVLKFLANKDDAKRMKFSTLTKDELIEAYEKVSPHIDFGQLEAGLTRHELDWLWGINTTRALTLALKSAAERGFTILSSGRVQSPTLAILLERELEIRKFKPKPFWELELHVKIDGTEAVASYEKGRMWKKEDADKVLQACKGKDAVVKEIKKKNYKQAPPVPFNTTDLQAEAYQQFKFSPQQTMNIAESLYQAGYISYPRSSSQKLPPSVNYERILKALASLPQYKKFAEELLKKEKLVPVEGKREDPAHPAVYATHEVPELSKLTAQQKKIYDLIARRTLAVFGDEAMRESNTVSLDVAGHVFLLIGKRTIEPGWTKIYEPYLKREELILPELKIGQIVKVIKLEELAKETQPPARYSQGSIIKEMEARNLGTRATRSEILQTLYERGYITGKSIQVTKLGEAVAQALKEYCSRILSEELTRKFEEEMELVYNEKKKREEVVKEAKKTLKEILEEFKVNEKKIGKKLLEALMTKREEERRLGNCPNCKAGELRILRSRASGKFFVGCSSYPKCKTGYPLPGGASVQATGNICEKCSTPIIQVFRKGKRPFRMCLDPKCETKKDWGKNKSKKTKS